MAVTKLKIGTASLKDDAFGGLEALDGGLVCNGSLVCNDFTGGGLYVAGSEIWCGTTVYFHMEPVSPDLTVNAPTTFTEPIAAPEVKVTLVPGSNTCGSDTISGGSVTITTNKVFNTSVILLTATDSNTASNLYVSSVNSGTSFEVRGNDGTFNWLIINPI